MAGKNVDEKEMAAIRRENLRGWMTAREITSSQLADKIGSGRAYTSLLFNPSRYFGEKAARHIEECLRMPRGYLDTTAKAVMTTDSWSTPQDLDDEVFALVRQVDIGLDANGQVVTSEIKAPALPFSKGWLLARRVTASKQLRICTVRSTGMEPFARVGDQVMLDTGQTAVEDGEVYAIRHGSQIRLRRLFATVDGGLQLHADNPSHPSETLTKEASAELAVLGRVIWRAG